MLKPLCPRIEFTTEQLQHTASAAMMSTTITSPSSSTSPSGTSSSTAVLTTLGKDSSTKTTNSILQHSEFTAMLLGFMTPSIRIIRRCLPTLGIAAPQTNAADCDPDMWECPNTQLVLTCWKNLDIRPLTAESENTKKIDAGTSTLSTSIATVTCRDLSDGANTLHLGYYNPCTKQTIPVNLSGDILIRTR